MLEIKFNTNTAAFDDEDFIENGTINNYIKRKEIVRILEHIAFQIKADHNGGPIMDLNGNKIGEWKITEED